MKGDYARRETEQTRWQGLILGKKLYKSLIRKVDVWWIWTDLYEHVVAEMCILLDCRLPGTALRWLDSYLGKSQMVDFVVTDDCLPTFPWTGKLQTHDDVQYSANQPAQNHWLPSNSTEAGWDPIPKVMKHSETGSAINVMTLMKQSSWIKTGLHHGWFCHCFDYFHITEESVSLSSLWSRLKLINNWLHGLPWTLQTFMVPSWWNLMSLVILWFFQSCYNEVYITKLLMKCSNNYWMALNVIWYGCPQCPDNVPFWLWEFRLPCSLAQPAVKVWLIHSVKYLNIFNILYILDIYDPWRMNCDN